jgi:GMP synthase (glutamine-hydrolysing)
MTRLAFVLSERRAGLTAERLERYRQTAERLSGLAGTPFATPHYADDDAFDADVLVLSGSADAWLAHGADELARLDERLRRFDGPVLGICAGMQTVVRAAGGEIATAAAPTPEGFAAVEVLDSSDLLAGLAPRIEVLEHHTDEARTVPAGFRVLARSAGCAVEAVAANDRPWWGTQFHPELWSDEHPAGRAVLVNFLRLAGVDVEER